MPLCSSAGHNWNRFSVEDHVPRGPHSATTALVSAMRPELPAAGVCFTRPFAGIERVWTSIHTSPQGHSRAGALPQLDPQLHPRFVGGSRGV
jgi:hypothetical protein